VYLFTHGLPTADLWQDDAWRARLETLQVGPEAPLNDSAHEPLAVRA
jgi:hypothetical protein